MSAPADSTLRWVLSQDTARARAVAAVLGLTPRELEALEDPDAGDGACLVLYEAPWEGCLALEDTDATGEASPVDAWLADWERFYAQVCVAQLQNPGRVELVNAGRDDAPAVIARLAGRPADADIHSSLEAVLPGGMSPWSQVLGAWMADASGTTWRTYEALESGAQSEDRTAEFRLGQRTEGDGRFGAAVRAITRARLAADSTEPELIARLEDTVDDLQRENALMAAQLEQVHSELEQQASSEQALHALVVDAGHAATQARRWISEPVDNDGDRPA